MVLTNLYRMQLIVQHIKLNLSKTLVYPVQKYRFAI